MIKYNFIFEGKVDPGLDVQAAMQRLAKVFHCDPKVLKPLFDGEAVYERLEIDKLSAQSHQRQFLSAGCQSVIEPVGPETLNNTRQRSIAEPTLGARETDQEPKDEHTLFGFGQLSSHLLMLSCFMVIVLVTIDPFLQGFTIEGHAGIDMGPWPFLLAHVFLVLGCIAYVKSRQLPSWWGFLGIFSLAGLATLIALEKRHTQGELPSKDAVIAVFCLSLLIYWISGWVGAALFYQQHQFEAKNVLEHRSEYPDKNIQSQHDFNKAHDQIKNFLQQSLLDLNEKGFRPNQVEAIANTTFNTLARHQIWENHQIYLKGMHQAYDTDFLKQEKQNNRELMEIINRYVTYESSPRLNEVLQRWFYGYSPNRVSDESERLSRELVRLVQTLYQIPKPESGFPILENMPWQKYLRIGLKDTKVLVEDNLILIDFVSGEYAGRQLVLGVYWKPKEKQSFLNKKKGTSIVFSPHLMVVAPGFDVRELSNSAGVFHTYR